MNVDSRRGARPVGGLFDDQAMSRLRMTPLETEGSQWVPQSSSRVRLTWATVPRPLWLWIFADLAVTQAIKRGLLEWPPQHDGGLAFAQLFQWNFLANSLIGLPIFVAFLLVWRENAAAVASRATRLRRPARDEFEWDDPSLGSIPRPTDWAAPRASRARDAASAPVGPTNGVIVACPRCGTRVQPTVRGHCPACRSLMDPKKLGGTPLATAPATTKRRDAAGGAHGDPLAVSTALVPAVLVAHAAQQLRDGVSRSEVVAGLIGGRLGAAEAAGLVSRLERAEALESRRRGRQEALLGATIFLVGLAVTAVTYRMAVTGEVGLIIVAVGAMVFGVFGFLRGIAAAMEE